MARIRRLMMGLVACLVLLGVAMTGAANAKTGSPSVRRLQQLLAGPPQKLQVPGSALFGFSVSLSADGNTALVGAPNTDPPLGAAYVFVRSGSTWNLLQKLSPPAPPASGILRFGTSVSLSADGRTALIGAQGSNPAVGGEDAAYVYARGFVGNFAFQAKLINPAGPFSGNAFGTSVSISSDGRTALVGAPAPGSSSVVNTGAAYLYARNFFTGIWILQQLIRPTDTNTFDSFGVSVALASDAGSALIGAPSRDNTGAAYTFSRLIPGGPMLQQQKLQAADRATGDAFGTAVALSGDSRTALIGAPPKPTGGAAYVFTRGFFGGFTQQQKLQASNRASGDEFGTSVALNTTGSRALIGARGTDGDQGSAYVFGRGFVGGYTQLDELEAPVRVAGDFFGWSVSLNGVGGTGLIGAPEIRATPAPGSAYVFTGL